MTLARLRHLALSLQAWLIELNYDVVLTGNDCQFVLSVCYHGFNYSARHISVTLPIPYVDYSIQVIEIDNKHGKIIIEVNPLTPHIILKNVVETLTVLKKQAEYEDVRRLVFKTGQQALETALEAVAQPTSRESKRAITHRYTIPPKPHYPTKKKY